MIFFLLSSLITFVVSATCDDCDDLYDLDNDNDDVLSCSFYVVEKQSRLAIDLGHTSEPEVNWHVASRDATDRDRVT